MARFLIKKIIYFNPMPFKCSLYLNMIIRNRIEQHNIDNLTGEYYFYRGWVKLCNHEFTVPIYIVPILPIKIKELCSRNCLMKNDAAVYFINGCIAPPPLLLRTAISASLQVYSTTSLEGEGIHCDNTWYNRRICHEREMYSWIRH